MSAFKHLSIFYLQNNNVIVNGQLAKQWILVTSKDPCWPWLVLASLIYTVANHSIILKECKTVKIQIVQQI